MIFPFHALFFLGLRLTVEGVAACEWIIDLSGQIGTRNTYNGQEKCFESISYLFGSKDGESTEIPAGTHIYDFSCPLPAQIPYSAESLYGYVRYKVAVNLQVSLGFDLNTKQTFSVVGIEDLNFFPELKIGSETEEVKRFCCWMCKSDPLTLRVCLPKTGFALGEKIPASVDIINKSSTDVLHSTFSLVRVYNLKCTLPREKVKTVRENVTEHNTIGAKSGETVIFEELVPVPKDIPITNNRYSKVFQVSYELKVVAETGGFSVSSELSVPITIGSVALAKD